MVIGSGPDERVIADLRRAPHDLGLVDGLARWRLAAARIGVVVAVRPCGHLRRLLVLVGLSGLEAEHAAVAGGRCCDDDAAG